MMTILNEFRFISYMLHYARCVLHGNFVQLRCFGILNAHFVASLYLSHLALHLVLAGSAEELWCDTAAVLECSDENFHSALDGPGVMASVLSTYTTRPRVMASILFTYTTCLKILQHILRLLALSLKKTSQI
ncbi:hypothetical protein Tco_0679886 [Tanacetum coccineum]|uniref:Uncharacterized protein n=1 Tax=Tanacetum coccineum TaxID=301880 RepID=A0ABQ4XKJ5_9ASTR